MRTICKTTEVGPGSVKRIEVDGLPPLAVYNLGGRFYVTDDTCTHGKASLADERASNRTDGPSVHVTAGK